MNPCIPWHGWLCSWNNHQPAFCFWIFNHVFLSLTSSVCFSTNYSRHNWTSSIEQGILRLFVSSLQWEGSIPWSYRAGKKSVPPGKPAETLTRSSSGKWESWIPSSWVFCLLLCQNFSPQKWTETLWDSLFREMRRFALWLLLLPPKCVFLVM